MASFATWSVAAEEAKVDPSTSCVEAAKGPIIQGGADDSKASSTQASDAKPMRARVGKPAIDFEANAYHDGKFKNIKLSDYKGKWVVLCFYPGDYTFVWPTELTAVAARYAELKKLNAEVLAMSTDSRFTHKMWNATELSKMIDGGIPYPMLSDAGGKIGWIYGVYEEGPGVDIRGRFIIDPDGVIQAMEVLTPSVGRNPEELVRQLKAFQHARSTGEATPSGWHPGETTLKPGPDLVGNVWKVWKPEK
jgi:alkyl hydroperoxide reductase subunit AhpC